MLSVYYLIIFFFLFLMNEKHFIFRSEASIQFSRTCLFVAELSFAYFLMLITMTYNTWLFIAVVIGRGLGYHLVTPLIDSYVGSGETDDYSDMSMDSLLTRSKHQPL